MDENSLEQMPHTIGRYQIQESIGFGAMGAVYKAFDPLIKRTLAIKTIRLDIPRQSPQYKSFIERFYHEARISGTLSHPNIVTLFDIGEEGGIPYLAMEFVEGDTISGLIERGQRFNPERVISLVSQIASAVDYAHSKGVIHRDIKPSNLILYEGERVKVTDFGIAKLVDAEMTQSGTLLGTPSYMSPEQAMGDKLDGRSDIFSLGVCAFEMLSGEQPFPGNNVTSILYKLVHVEPVQPANLEMNGLVPQKWHEVFGRVLAKRPDDRYQTATDFVQDLEYCLGAWFGSAVGDDADATIVGSAPSATDVTTALPGTAGNPAAPPPAPALDAAPAAAAPAPPTPPPAARATGSRPAVAPMPEADEPMPPTVHMKAKAEERARVSESAPPSSAAAPAGAAEGTVLLSAPVFPPAATPPASPEEDDEPASTVLLKAGQVPALAPPAAHPAPPASPVPPPAPAQEKTVMMSAAMLGTATPRKDPPPAPPAQAESTVMMSALGAKPGSGEITEQSPIPAELKAPAPEVKRPPTAPPVAPQALPRPPVSKPSPPAPTPTPVAAPLPPVPSDGGAPKKGVPLGLILGGVGLVLFLVAILGGILLYRRFAGTVTPVPSPTLIAAPTTTLARPPVTTATPPPMATTGSLHVESTPSGATVTVDGESRGVTPLDLADLPLGSHEVKVEMKGFTSSVQRVDVTEQAPADLKLTLVRPAAATGLAEILSNPSGATVSIDGSPAGPTPITDLKLKPGSHRVDVSREGYESWSGSINVLAGKRARVDAVLRAIPKATPTPPPETVDANRVYVNAASDVDVLAKKIGGSSASYPTDRAPRLRSGEAVSVTVSYIVTENGEVSELKLVESGGKVVDEAVLSAIRTWKYSPATKKGVKVKVRTTFKQTFRAG